MDERSDAERLLTLLSDKPTTRLYLSLHLGITERKVERLIAELRDAGEPICSNSETRGYWLSTGADLTRTIKEMEHRALQVLQRARKMKDRQLEGQVEYHEKDETIY